MEYRLDTLSIVSHSELTRTQVLVENSWRKRSLERGGVGQREEFSGSWPRFSRWFPDTIFSSAPDHIG